LLIVSSDLSDVWPSDAQGCFWHND